MALTSMAKAATMNMVIVGVAFAPELDYAAAVL
jgi:hypothetical protein